jgi:hypothetical protein
MLYFSIIQFKEPCPAAQPALARPSLTFGRAAKALRLYQKHELFSLEKPGKTARNFA